MNANLFDTIMDNCADGIYVLDDKGIYLFANSVYVQSINMTKSELIGFDVHNFLRTKIVDFLISDIVYKEKRRVVMFQDVYHQNAPDNLMHRQLIIATPIFNEKGAVNNVVAVVRRLDTMHDFYHQASMGLPSPLRMNTEDAKSRNIIAESPAMLQLLKNARTVAEVDAAVLILGESGTGKDVVAQYIHASGPRSSNRLVVINCASLPSELLEAELFGYEKGAFTGAAGSGKAGLFEVAHQGTLFLDEINSLPLDLQGKLLRALETKQIQRLGSTQAREVDFRLLTASNENLQQLVDAKLFRADLFYRLNVIPLTVPPLRKRVTDILPLTLHFLRQFCEKHNKNKIFTEDTLALIHSHTWPGNVRELKNFVERSVVMSIGEYIEIHNIDGILANAEGDAVAFGSDAATGSGGIDYGAMLQRGISLDNFLKACERSYISYALKNTQSTYQAARVLGTSQSSIMRRKKKFHL
jgi:transcriptional regulator with PAS, ATPase and Fis domain